MTPDALYERLVERFAAIPDVTLPDMPGARGWGASTLRVHGRIFAMLSDGRLVVKLPRPRVDALIASDAGERFSTSRGPLKEWVALASQTESEWFERATEALAFVRAAGVRG